MNLHEYQAKELLRRYGVPVPPFFVFSHLDELRDFLKKSSWKEGVLKVQVHAGGRGKAGGVKIVASPEAMERAAEELLGMKIVNSQTGAEGMVARHLLVTPRMDYVREMYMAMMVDRKKKSRVLVASPSGGMDIEEIASKHPERLLSVPVSLEGTLASFHQIRLAKFMGWRWDGASPGLKLASALAKAFVETDASLLEINPLVETEGGELWVLDAKLAVDDNALFRQEALAKIFDSSQLSKGEARAKEHDLAYVSMEGEIGCMVNGAGLAMATMDILQHEGGSPANFLDVGGGASEEKVAEGFKLILSDPKVKAILVNIFGGITSCVTLAAGILTAARQQAIRVPLVVRLEGTQVEEGKRLLKESGLPFLIASSLGEAAQKAVNSLKK